VTGKIMSMKNSNDTIGNQTCDLSVCNVVPQPTAPPRAPIVKCVQFLILLPVGYGCARWMSLRSHGSAASLSALVSGTNETVTIIRMYIECEAHIWF